MNPLETAIQIALDAHKGQVDKGGHPYILHPLRLMHNVGGLDEKIVAVLHDVVEDANITFEDLECEGISKSCLDALKLLTHDKNVPYMEYIQHIATNPLAKAVKLADLKDNSDLSRLKEVTEKDKERLRKYRIAIAFLDQ